MNRSIFRLMDANANRAREAMRVMEDAARFAYDDCVLALGLKALRHDFAGVIDDLERSQGSLALHRDTACDVGTTLTTEREMQRADMGSVITAAGKRLTEAVRSLEEYAKVLHNAPGIAARFEALRYQAYGLEQALLLRATRGKVEQWAVCLLLTRGMCRLGWREVLEACLEAGVDAVQVREKDLSARSYLAVARETIEACRSSMHAAGQSVRVIVNDRPDVAMLAGADGVHVGQDDLAVQDVRQLVGHAMLVGVSTSRVAEVEAAVGSGGGGADYVGLGPMFATTTKRKDHLVGPGYVTEVVGHERVGSVPHLAIGGIGVANVSEVLQAGARGVAVCGAVCGSDQPGEVMRRLVLQVRGKAQLPLAHESG